MTALSVGALSGILGTVGAAVGAIGQLESAQYQSEVAAQQAQEQRIIANELEQQAKAQVASGQQAAAAASQKSAAEKANAEGAFAANNITGKSKDEVISSLDKQGQFDATNVLSSAEWQAYQTRTQKQSALAQAGLDTAASQQAAEAGPIAAFGSLISNAGSVFSGKWGGGFTSSTSSSPVGAGTPVIPAGSGFAVSP